MGQMPAVAILGAGPAGLLSAWACSVAGRPFAIFSLPEKSALGGAQFLHKPIPGLTSDEPEAVLTYRVRGTVAGYQRKVYGDDEVPFVSMSGIVDGATVPAWSLRDVYDRLWDLLSRNINPVKINQEFLGNVTKDFQTVISSVPATTLCRARAGEIGEVHHFRTQEITVALGEYVPIPNNTILYNGSPHNAWYRASRIFDTWGCEFRGNVKPPMGVDRCVKDSKPISTNCNCWFNIHRVGRRGSWTKGVLSHDGFDRTLELIGS